MSSTGAPVVCFNGLAPAAIVAVHGFEPQLHPDVQRLAPVLDGVVCSNWLSCALYPRLLARPVAHGCMRWERLRLRSISHAMNHGAALAGVDLVLFLDDAVLARRHLVAPWNAPIARLAEPRGLVNAAAAATAGPRLGLQPKERP